MNTDKRMEACISQLFEAAQDDDFIYLCDDIINELEKLSSHEEAIEPILRLMEANPHVDFGIPGPLVHFLEKQNRDVFVNQLLESLRRKPTLHTLWMLNSLINVSSGNKKTLLLSTMSEIAHNAELDPLLTGEAQECLEFQQKRSTFYGQ